MILYVAEVGIVSAWHENFLTVNQISYLTVKIYVSVKEIVYSNIIFTERYT